MLIGENIRFYRQQHDLSQEELAEKMDTSRQTISSWENGKTYPNIQSLISLSNIFNTSVEDLIKEEVEDMKQSVERNTHPLKRNKDREVLNSSTFAAQNRQVHLNIIGQTRKPLL